MAEKIKHYTDNAQPFTENSEAHFRSLGMSPAKAHEMAAIARGDVLEDRIDFDYVKRQMTNWLWIEDKGKDDLK